MTATDDDGLTVTDTFTWTITNVDPVATDNSNSINEGGTTSSGNVLTDNDGNGIDADGSPDSDALSVSAIRTGTEAGSGTSGTLASSLTGSYGALVMNADGGYTYTIDNSNSTVQALNTGDTLTETFTYTLTDQEGGTDTAELTITINLSLIHI